MANIKVLGSSSKGNCYVLETENEIIIIEAGLTLKKIKEGLNFDISKVIGCLVTHEHKDHSKAISGLSNLGIEIFASSGTLLNEKFDPKFNYLIGTEKIINDEVCLIYKKFSVGGFDILPFQTQHDCNEPLGFIIEHKEVGKLLFATDTYYVKWNFKNLNHIFIECNYQKEMLEENLKSGVIERKRAMRLLKSHFELKNVINFLNSCVVGNLKNIVLMHLSGDNADSKVMKKEIKEKTGYDTIIAKKDVVVDLELLTF